MSTSTSGIQQHLLTFTVCITICILISFAQLVAWPAWQRTTWHPGCHKPRVAVWEHKCWKNSPTSTTIQSTDRLNFMWHQAQENTLRDALCTCSIPIHLILGPWPSFLTKETCLQQVACAASPCSLRSWMWSLQEPKLMTSPWHHIEGYVCREQHEEQGQAPAARCTGAGSKQCSGAVSSSREPRAPRQHLLRRGPLCSEMWLGIPGTSFWELWQLQL